MTTVKYTHLVELGQGAFGKVCRAYDPVLDRHVVLKIFKSKSAPLHITNEARVQAASRIKSIPEIFEVSREKGRVRLAMEWVKGLSISQFTRMHLPTAEELLDIARLLTAALEDLHQHQLLHGDLNPQNILCTIEGSVSVIDFGFSGLPDRESAVGRGGTPVYTAPEVLDGSGRTSVAADIYSLGAILIELFFHLPPEQARDTDKTFRTGQNKPEEVFSNNLLQCLWPILLRCICMEPESRWASASELASALEQLEFSGSRNWRQALELNFGSFLSAKLTKAAEDLLKKGKNTAAFSLLKEAVTWAPDNATALGVLEKSDFSTVKKFRWQVAAGALGAGLVLCAAVFLMLPKKRAEVIVLLPEKDLSTRIAAETISKKRPRSTHSGPLKTAVPGNPTGSLRFIGFDRDLDVRVDNKPVGFLGNSLSLTPGSHHIEAYRDGKLMISKIFDIKPFQKLKLDYSKLREAHD